MKINEITNIDALTGLQQLPDKSVQCIVTSPPYFGLRAYGTTPFAWPAVNFSILGFPVSIPELTCELGQEPDHFAFIGHLILIFREASRVLRDDGTIWLNMGDSYVSTAQGTMGDGLHIKGISEETKNSRKMFRKKYSGVKPKDLVGIPWMLAFALRDDGFYLRQDIIWSKPNPMPESVTDRCTKAHEYIFMLSKSPKYYYDAAAIRTPAKESSIARLAQDVAAQDGSSRVPGKSNGKMKAVMTGFKPLPDGQANIRAARDKQRGHSRKHSGFNDRWDQMSTEEQMSMGANKRDVWTVSTKPFKDAHFATFPEDLIVDMIKAGSRIDDTILDMFMGAGTTALVARKLNRNFIGSELNPDYIKIANKRLESLGLFR